MHRLGLSLLIVVAAATRLPLAAQQPAPAFEIASVKRNTSGERDGTAGPRPGGRFVMVNLPVVRLIRAAYPNLTAAQVSGGPEWVNTERYDITATAGRDVTATEMERLLRRQEKLGLKLESARGPVEVLVFDSIQRPTPD